ncbi:MAG TPA: molecular chaperone DnaJ [Alphaproteobacteria bacterium]|nr:molecular chaperone DnaJ [Alphaproteobacteria bacterium]
MAKSDYYELLGVDRGADDAAIKKAFRKMAMKYHPDQNPDDDVAERKFKEVNEAYEVLKDPQKRAAYDQYGHAAFEQGGPGAGGFEAGMGGFGDVFEDIFSEFMGGGRQRQRSGPSRGSDMRYNLSISLHDAFHGRKMSIRIPGIVSCDACSGTGSADGSKPVNCPTCQGHGKVRAQQGFFTIERTCPTCGGQGQTVKDPCRLCRGSGKMEKERNLSVSVPKGVEDGQRIRLAGEGEAGTRGGPAGDLYIFLQIEPHSLFQREGPNLICEVPVPMTTAALGGSVEIPSLDGTKGRITIPAGTQTGKKFRLKGKGMPILRQSRHGDLFVSVMVETPVNLSARQRELLAEFATGGDNNSPEHESFFDKVVDFFSADGDKKD